MFNLDMIGHLADSVLTIGGSGTSPGFEELLTSVNKKYNTNLKLSNEGYGPSDHAAFYSKDIPVLFFFTGTHDDYHKPTDDFPIINLEGEKLISDFVQKNLNSLKLVLKNLKPLAEGSKLLLVLFLHLEVNLRAWKLMVLERMVPPK
jgi:hypothetical protein